MCDVANVQAVYISRITDGGPAAADGKLAVGDRITLVRCQLEFIDQLLIKN